MSDVLKSENNEVTFENFKNENGMPFWWASDLMRMLDYKDMSSFKKVLDKATKTCITLGIPHYDNFIAEMRTVEGHNIQDFKLTRFACYLTVMNGDTKKEPVASAQVYFAENTRKFELYIQNSKELERLLIRDELKEGHKTLARAAKWGGVQDFAKFNNAGYLGMYNMYNWKLAKSRNVDIKKLYDYMGRTELAANLFRITQTEERIKNKNVKGQADLEQTHYQVGKEVREFVVKNTGTAPENLSLEREIPKVQKELKQGYRKMLKADNKPKKKNKKN